MTKPQPIVRQLLLTLVVAVGMLAAWGVAVIWLAALVENTGGPRQQIENLYMRFDGEPVIMRYQSGAYPGSQQLFTLDGQPARGNSQQVVYPTYLQSPPHTLAATYPFRLAGANDGGTPAIYWYLFHDGRVNGRAYGVGYNAVSKMVVGYFGRSGFSHEQPPRDDWFQIAGESGVALATPSITNTEPVYGSGPILHLLAEGQLWLIDVRKKLVKPLLACPTAFTVGWISQTLAELPPEEDYEPGTVQFTAAQPGRKLAVRSLDSLTIVDPRSGEHVAVPLPSSLQDKSCACFQRADGSFVLISYPLAQNAGRRQYVVWLDEAGVVQREQQVHVVGAYSVLSSPGLVGWVAAIAAPLPLASVLMALGVSAERWAMQEFDTFSAALAATLADFWPGGLALAAVSLALAIVAYRRQRRYALAYPLFWAVFVFLLGVPGWLAYRFHRVWPALEDCPRCGELSPRDREHCADCGAAFPPPPLKGLEIFA